VATSLPLISRRADRRAPCFDIILPHACLCSPSAPTHACLCSLLPTHTLVSASPLPCRRVTFRLCLSLVLAFSTSDQALTSYRSAAVLAEPFVQRTTSSCASLVLVDLCSFFHHTHLLTPPPPPPPPPHTHTHTQGQCLQSAKFFTSGCPFHPCIDAWYG
jgi:hypothetical protein